MRSKELRESFDSLLYHEHMLVEVQRSLQENGRSNFTQTSLDSLQRYVRMLLSTEQESQELLTLDAYIVKLKSNIRPEKGNNAPD